MRELIEVRFERFGRAVVRRPWTAIGSMLVLALALASQLPPPLETAVENFFEEDAPARVTFDAFRDQFGRADLVMVAIKPPDVFDLAFLEELRSLHDALEDEVPHLDEVSSLMNVRSTRGEADELIVEDLIEEIPTGEEELSALRERVLSNPFYRNTLVSEDGGFTALLVTLALHADDPAEEDATGGFGDAEEAGGLEEPRGLTGFEVGQALDVVREVVERHRAPKFEVAMAGSLLINQQIVNSMQRDIPRFVGVTALTVCGLLFLLFRRVAAVFLPLLVVILSLVSTVGTMAATGAPITPPSQVLPTFLLAVGIGAAVHVLKIFYLRYDLGDSVEDAVAYTMSHSGLPIVMTGLTTAGGLLSFLAAGLKPISDLGIFAPLGVGLAVAYCLVLLPALLAVLPIRRKPPERDSSLTRSMEKAIVRVGDYSATHPAAMVSLVAVIAAISIPGIAQLRFTNDIMGWLPPGDPLIEATELIDHELRGSITLEVIVDTGRENGVKSPAFLAGLDELRTRIEPLTSGDELFVGRTISIADVVKEIHQALNENRADYYAIPDDVALVSQELLLFENSGSDDLEDVVDSQFSLARFTIKVPYVDPFQYGTFIEDVEAEFRDVFGETVTIETTGFMGMMSQTVRTVILGMARSYGLALAIITPLMIVLLGSLRTGLASMVPNLTPIMLTLGVMGWLGVSIDMFTMMIGSIAIGLVVDDTIHFMHGFRRYFAQSGDARAAVRETLETTGQALLFTSITLALGFLVFTASQMENLAYFGAFTCLAIVAAFLLDILVSPALMVLATRGKQR